MNVYSAAIISRPLDFERSDAFSPANREFTSPENALPLVA
ncbi:MAG: hypothetical protein QOI40_302, partial [Alphaproteobacteria bacterium]|nr:hypothetical protein [Alphaproteobacteria bacterium]